MRLPGFLLRWLLAEDMTFNVLLLHGKLGITMSETFARWRRDGNPMQKAVGRQACADLDLVDKGHCDRVLAAADERDKALA